MQGVEQSRTSVTQKGDGQQWVDLTQEVSLAVETVHKNCLFPARSICTDQLRRPSHLELAQILVGP